MTKIDTVILEYEHCVECAYEEKWALNTDKSRCHRGKRSRTIPDIWGDIPDWCPLEEKE